MYFGLYLDGNPQEMMELYDGTTDVRTRIEIVESCYKFQALSSRQQTYFKKACDSEQDPELRMVLIKMLSHFHVPGMAEQIGVLWDFGAYPEAISVICYSGGWAVKEAWWPRVLERMPTLQGQAFRDACDIFFILDQNDKNSLFRCLSELNGREEVLDYFLDYLPDERNHERAEYLTLIYAIWVTKGVQTPPPRLERVWVSLLDKFRTTQDAKKSNLLQPDELSGQLRSRHHSLRRYFRFLLWKQELQSKLLFVGGFHLLGEIPLDKCHLVSSRSAAFCRNSSRLG